MQPLDLYAIPLRGWNLIEASAGTGKTFTIAALYLRLVLELAIPVERILVVTYTNAATAELRQRIRQRLIESRDALQQNSGDDALLEALERCGIDRDLACKRVQHALLGFDRAAVFTIHGFCQRVLTDNAFTGGLPFENELLTEQSELLQEVVDDFWRRRIQQFSPGMLDYLLKQKITPDYLAALLQGHLGKPYLLLRGCPSPPDLEQLEADFNTIFNSAREQWLQQREEISRLLLESPGLNRNRYRINSIPGWLSAMHGYLAAAPGPWFDQFEKFCSATLADSLNKYGTAPSHPFFDLCQQLLESRAQLFDAYQQRWTALLEELLRYADTELVQRKAQRQLLSYDDLLLNLHRALQGEGGRALAASISADYSAVLIDEFQDTDPLQYQIFNGIYGAQDAPLFLVGDPKQAIYSFRGADIFSYLKAAGDVRDSYSLEHNWRSTPELIRGINTLFNQDHKSFIYSGISYNPVSAAATEQERLQDDDDAAAALRIGLIDSGLNVEQALERAVLAAAGEVGRLLRQGSEGSLRIGGRAVVGGDIALLVRTHRQGMLLKQALLKLGINSVQNSQQNVFQSRTALHLERLLKAVLEPVREGLVRAALTSDIIAVDGNQLATMEEARLEQFMESFQNYHLLWREHGFMRMFRHLLIQQAVPVRLLRLEEGERRLTDLMHLAELLHQHEQQTGPGMALLLSWYSRQLKADRAESEASQLRLESDDQLVQIVTVHKSKGLEYPIVLYPFGWDSGAREISNRTPYSFHDPATEYSPVLELGSPQWQSDKPLAQNEGLAESVRLLYVALTRARYRCYLYWGKVNNAGRSALAWLLHPPPDPGDGDLLKATTDHFSGLDEREIRDRVQRLVDAANGSVAMYDIEPQAAVASVLGKNLPAPAQLCARHFQRVLSSTRRMTSFSALSSRQGSIELPDHDRIDQPLESLEPPVSGGNIFSFPRGARAGSALHAVFERLDFTCYTRAELETLVQAQLQLYDIETDWQAVVCDMVEQVLSTPVDQANGIRLRQIDTSHRLVELGFYYPLASINAAGLSRLLLKQGFAGNQVLKRAIEGLTIADVHGFMKGYIDLVFEAGGRFYLLDYKSNWLGDQTQDYGQVQMEQAMAREHYYLQYLFYVLALHRYLRKRIPDYRYETHFGEVIYLFLRGIDADTRTGVYRTRPQQSVIDALDSYIGQPPGERI